MKRTTASLPRLATFITHWLADRARALAASPPGKRTLAPLATVAAGLTLAVAVIGGISYASPPGHPAAQAETVLIPDPVALAPPAPGLSSVKAQAARYAQAVIQASASASASRAAAAEAAHLAAVHRAAVAAAQHAAAVAAARAAAQRAAAAPAPPAAAPAHPQVTGSWESLVYTQASSGSAWCAIQIFLRESGGNVYAENPSSGAYGIPQALPGSKMASAGADWRTDPVTQIRWGLGYMTSTYGSPCAAWAFWQGHSYY